MTIAFIGGGNIAESMIAAVRRRRLTEAADILVAEPQPSRRQFLTKKYRLRVVEDARSAVSGAGLVVLAIKPQDLSSVLAQLTGKLAQDQLLLSVVAGATLDILRNGHSTLVRAMPNINARGGTAV
ncbi:MAG: NAD(P)-binding domain-containing protein, partial [Arenicellales bacterium]|nr:NAD(P)-binding domain-containing protein [Arenicellales bacterium]